MQRDAHDVELRLFVNDSPSVFQEAPCKLLIASNGVGWKFSCAQWHVVTETVWKLNQQSYILDSQQ